MRRNIATFVILIGMFVFAVPQGFSQERESAAQERREQQQRVHRDVPADLQRARQALQNALRELEGAGDQWGGYRAAAMGHVNKALEEIQKAEAYARQHKLVK